jgi:cell wall-associated NlpC family hydrolase
MEIQAPGAGSAELRRSRRGAVTRSRRAVAIAALLCAALLTAGCGREAAGDGTSDRASEPEEVVLTPEAARQGRKEQREHPRAPNSKAQVVELLGAGSAESIEVDPKDDAPSPGAPTDAEVRVELREARASLANFKKHLNTTAFLQTGPRARVLSDGTAVAPENAPDVVKRVIMAANEIAKFPYKWGGGHGAWRDNGYDCSGSVSFALAGAGLLKSPLTSGGFLNYGAPGVGRWITIYTHSGHMFMVVGGLRFDTSGQGRAGTRWQEGTRSTAGFAARHIPGL